MLVAAACVGVVAGAMLQAATGFGFSLVAAPLLFAAIGPEPAVVLLLVLGLEVNLLTLGTERRRPRPLQRSTAIDARLRDPRARWPASPCCARCPRQALQVAVTLGVAGTLAARRVRDGARAGLARRASPRAR